MDVSGEPVARLILLYEDTGFGRFRIRCFQGGGDMIEYKLWDMIFSGNFGAFQEQSAQRVDCVNVGKSCHDQRIFKTINFPVGDQIFDPFQL